MRDTFVFHEGDHLKQENDTTMLIGEYTHTIDDKKRISLPSKFRKEIGKKVIITQGLDGCLFLYSLKEWEKISARVAEMGMANSESRGFNRFLLSSAADVDVDGSGRILIPDNIKEFAGIKNKVVFAGVYNRIELWDEGRWTTYKTAISSQAEKMAEKLGDVGIF